MPLVVAGGLLAVPDAPAALFWTTTLWCAVKAVRSRSLAWWAAAGVAAGLATLSKYSALFLAPGVLLWLLSEPGARKQLATPGPWVAAALAVIIFSGNVLWNADHHWLTFTKQFGRIAPTRFAPGHLADFLAAQLLLINPLIAIFLFRSLTEASMRATLTPLVAISAPFASYLLVHSLHDSVQAHWPAPIYPAVAICAALAAGRMMDRPGWAALRRSASVLGFALFPLLLLVLLVPTPITTRLISPVLGWSPFARRLEDERIARGAAWIGVLSYGLAAELSDEPAIRAPIFQITERDRYLSLGMAAPDISRPGLIVDLYRRIDPAALRACFGQVTPLATIRRVDSSPLAKSYTLLFVSDPRRDVVRLGCGPGT
jgi:4-amino-4-deoxy-L-arabinose transferase-like glycosyltransferase